ncbi:uncharacterized protein UTRI_06728_B [Ustilago trichophora]|uniref:Uncharacterized protein n=1 Tax=Ustilago trichophora TaxID=86804 RepID=A0A5C3EN00_9BASI|nr:uncharacterized protein UTRI_06728_B [Ustilago trichophora]
MTQSSHDDNSIHTSTTTPFGIFIYIPSQRRSVTRSTIYVKFTYTACRFDAAQLQPHLSSVLTSRLRNATWDKSDKEKNRSLSRSIAEVIKTKMLEIEPRGS